MATPDAPARVIPDVLQPLEAHFELMEQHNAWSLRCLTCNLAWAIGKKLLPTQGAAFTAELLNHADGHPSLVYVSWDLARPWHIAYTAIPTRALCGLAMAHPGVAPPGWPKTTDAPDQVCRGCSDAKPSGGAFRLAVPS